MKLGNAIKIARSHFGVSQEELSERTGLTQTSISLIENGIKNPSARTIRKVCDALKIPDAVLYFLGVDEDDIPPSRKKMFQELYPQIRELAIQIIGDRNSKLLR